jgi:hypothetical protein
VAVGQLDLAQALASYPPLLPLGALYLGGLVAMIAAARQRSVERWLRLCAGCGLVAVSAVLGHWVFLLARGLT